MSNTYDNHYVIVIDKLSESCTLNLKENQNERKRKVKGNKKRYMRKIKWKKRSIIKKKRKKKIWIRKKNKNGRKEHKQTENKK